MILVTSPMIPRHLPYALLLGGATLAWGSTSLAPIIQAPVTPSNTAQNEPSPTAEEPERETIVASLKAARRHFEAGDSERALRAAEAVRTQSPRRTERAEAWMLSGWIHRDLDQHDLASAAFTQVRLTGTSLSAWASYYEAEQDLIRGRPSVARRECESYRASFSNGPYADACLRIMALGSAVTGDRDAALASARAWDELHPKTPITESIALKTALTRVSSAPAQSASELRKLLADHTIPMVGRRAEAKLLEMQQAGQVSEAYPTHNAFLQQRAQSLLTSYQGPAAWSAFEKLAERAPDDPSLMKWTEASMESFAWSSHRWGLVADAVAEQDPQGKDRNATWKRYRSLWRAGRWEEAAQQARTGLALYGTTRPWKNREETLGHTFLLAGYPDDALPLFETAASKGGSTGRRARFYAGLSAYLNGEPTRSKPHFDSIIDRNLSYTDEALYWRSKVAASMQDSRAAMADQASLIERDPYSWYATLLRQERPSLAQMRPYRRDGHWPTPHTQEDNQALSFLWPSRFETEASGALHPVQTFQTHLDIMNASGPPPTVGWVDNPSLIPTHSIIERMDESLPPSTSTLGTWFSRDASMEILNTLISEHGESWPELHGIRSLTRAGLYDLSGPAFSMLYETRRSARRSSSHPRHRAAKDLQLDQASWRSLAILTGDHEHTARLMHSLVAPLESFDSSESQGLMRLAYPLAHDRHVWEACKRHGIDPFLILSLMRQESLYDATAVSHAGAHGSMQILPRTAHLMALELGDAEFMSPDLEDPAIAIPYGVAYLGLLMERYQGAYPLAIASYNGGPFNVAAWHAARGGDTPLDLWVELIPYRETRGYVKKVSRNYAIYVDLYGPEGAHVKLPEVPISQNPLVVDF